MEKVNGIIYRDENNEKKAGIIVGNGDFKKIQLYQNIECGNILTKEEMQKEGAEMYDLGDDTNALSFDEYYRKASVTNVLTIIMEDGRSRKDVAERDIVDLVQLNVQMKEHIIYDNYNLYSKESMEEARACIMERKEGRKYASKEDIPENVIKDAISFNDEISWDVECSRLDTFFECKSWIAKGNFDALESYIIGEEFAGITSLWRSCESIKVYEKNGHFMIDASAPNSDRHFEIKLLTEEGNEYFVKHISEDDKAVRDVLWNDDKYTYFPCYAEKTIGVSTLGYSPFTVQNVENIFLTTFDHEELSDNLKDLTLFLENQSFRFDMDVQSIADNVIDLIEPLENGMYSLADLKIASTWMDMIVKIMDNNGFLSRDDSSFDWLIPARDGLEKVTGEKESLPQKETSKNVSDSKENEKRNAQKRDVKEKDTGDR